MRYGIFSDIHSNLEALVEVTKAFEKESIDTYLCLGDIVGYAANPNECIEKIRTLANVVVAGNHDWASVNLFSADYFNPDAREAIFWTRKNLNDLSRSFLESLELKYEREDLALVHGTLNDPKDFNYMTDGYVAEETFRLMGNNICFVGHTHIVGIFIKDRDEYISYQRNNSISIRPDDKYIVNVGSVGQPRDGNPKASYCVFDTDKKEVLIKRINYNIKATRKKIIKAGLPKFLGDRLLSGK